MGGWLVGGLIGNEVVGVLEFGGPILAYLLSSDFAVLNFLLSHLLSLCSFASPLHLFPLHATGYQIASTAWAIASQLCSASRQTVTWPSLRPGRDACLLYQ